MKFSALALTAATCISPTSAEFFFTENFNDDSWTSRWTESTTWKPKAEMGIWKHTAGEWFGNADDKGIQTSEDARFYGISAKLDKPFVSGDKPLVLQYTVKHEQKLDCGGAYIKLLPGGDNFDAAGFGGDAPYAIMFGPDICGSANKKTHVILHDYAKDDNLLVNTEVGCEKDKLTHLYTLIINTDNTFEVLIDNKSVRKGPLDEHFDFLPPKTIKDPDAKKPEDWVDQAKIVDPESKKPDDWDDQLEEIPDPDAKKPEDWDEEDDGEWEAPMIDNPDFNGVWKPKMIDNPDYRGKWEHPMIENPEYKYDENMYKVCKDGCTHVGFEIWQVLTGTLFDDIIVTDSVEEAKEYAEKTFFEKKETEKKMYDDKIAEERAAETPNVDDDYIGDFDMGSMGDLMGDEL
jgi:calreticulin